VRHACDNPACCNPLHLLAGTQTDNIADMMTRNRRVQGTSPFKLTKQQRLKIYELRKQGYSYPKIAAEVKCCVASAHRYVNNKIKNLN
jgi:DNA-binding NarL/FixJ family response regulator